MSADRSMVNGDIESVRAYAAKQSVPFWNCASLF
jgi:hypothetical protein